MYNITANFYLSSNADLLWKKAVASLRRVWNGSDLSENLLVRRESQVQHVRDVVVFHPHEGIVELLVYVLQVGDVAFGAQQSLVQWPGEKGVQQIMVDQSQTDNAARESEPEGFRSR